MNFQKFGSFGNEKIRVQPTIQLQKMGYYTGKNTEEPKVYKRYTDDIALDSGLQQKIRRDKILNLIALGTGDKQEKPDEEKVVDTINGLIDRIKLNIEAGVYDVSISALIFELFKQFEKDAYILSQENLNRFEDMITQLSDLIDESNTGNIVAGTRKEQNLNEAYRKTMKRILEIIKLMKKNNNKTYPDKKIILQGLVLSKTFKDVDTRYVKELKKIDKEVKQEMDDKKNKKNTEKMDMMQKQVNAIENLLAYFQREDGMPVEEEDGMPVEPDVIPDEGADAIPDEGADAVPVEGADAEPVEAVERIARELEGIADEEAKEPEPEATTSSIRIAQEEFYDIFNSPNLNKSVFLRDFIAPKLFKEIGRRLAGRRTDTINDEGVEYTKSEFNNLTIGDRIDILSKHIQTFYFDTYSLDYTGELVFSKEIPVPDAEIIKNNLTDAIAFGFTQEQLKNLFKNATWM